MRKIYLTEAQFKQYLKLLKEEEYSSDYSFGPYSTPEEVQAILALLRNKFGFTQNDSWIEGNYIKVMITKNNIDDSYYYEMLQAVEDFDKQLQQQHRMVSESCK